MALAIVFVHGWSVTNLDTYGELPMRLRNEAAKNGFQINVQEIFLGRYISFHDEVRLTDISRAFKTAVKDQLSGVTANGSRFICVTHSTGGPVIRDWWHRYYKDTPGADCPMSHLIMLAPANYGSALAQLGKGKLSRLNSWWNGVEPGQGVLDWLSLGSREAWEMNKNWIFTDATKIGGKGIFPFVITGQDIDRHFYDHLNTYTGEIGSDGVVRTAAANLQGRYIKLVQPIPVKNTNGQLSTGDFVETEMQEAIKTPLRVLTNKSHSGDEMGIMKSVSQVVADDISSETVKAIFDCIKVQNVNQYADLCKEFDKETDEVQKNEQIEMHDAIFPADRYFIHDRFSMVIFRVTDNEGFPVRDFDLVLTAGKNNDPNHLPVGFFVDRQQNILNKETITYFFNYDVMKGIGAVITKDGKILRDKIDGTDMLGFQITPRPDSGFVRYLPCGVAATAEMLEKVLLPNSTTLIDICLQRVVDKTVFRTDPVTVPKSQWDFSQINPSRDIVE